MLRMLAVEAVFVLAVFALQKVPRGWGWITLTWIVLVVATLPILLALARQTRESPSRAGGAGLLVCACSGLALAQIVFALVKLLEPKLFDIGTTTLVAVLALVHGNNPYTLPIDSLAGGIAAAGDRFHGYKYLPMMIIVYAPLCLSVGIRGIILTNLALQAATVGVVRSIAARGGCYFSGVAAAAIYLSLPLVTHQVFTRGVTDLAAVVPLLCALRYVDERPGLAGFLVGLSVATKLVPGMAVLPSLLPAQGKRSRYFYGVMLGLTPILPFAMAAPDAFVDNVVLFNIVRPADDTSWLFGGSAVVANIARALALGVVVGIIARVWHRPPDPVERCALAALAILAAFAVGPAMHHNYFLWFIPFLAILAGQAAIGIPVNARPSSVEGGRGNQSTVGPQAALGAS
jgi:hypothetical protein